MSYRSGAAMPSGGTAAHDFTVNVALTFDRANDPTALLEANWASRQQQLDALNDSGALDDLRCQHGELQCGAGLSRPGCGQSRHTHARPSNSGYVSSAESRTSGFS